MSHYDFSSLIVRVLKIEITEWYFRLSFANFTLYSFFWSNQTIANVKKMIYFFNSIELSKRNEISLQIKSVCCIQMCVISKAFIILVFYVVLYNATVYIV